MTGKAWLLPSDVAAIKKDMWDGTMTDLDMAVKYLVSRSHLSNIRRGRIHPDVPWPDGNVGPIPPEREKAVEMQKRQMRTDALSIRNQRIRTPYGIMLNPEAERAEAERVKNTSRRVFEMGWQSNIKQAKENGTYDPADFTDERKEEAWKKKVKADTKLDEQNRKKEEKQEKARLKASKKWHKEYNERITAMSEEPPTAEEIMEYARRRTFNWKKQGKLDPDMFLQSQYSRVEVDELMRDEGAYNWRKYKDEIYKLLAEQEKAIAQIQPEEMIDDHK